MERSTWLYVSGVMVIEGVAEPFGDDLRVDAG